MIHSRQCFSRLIFPVLLTILLIINSCFPNVSKNLTDRDIDLYNNVGFLPGQTPDESGNLRNPVYNPDISTPYGIQVKQYQQVQNQAASPDVVYINGQAYYKGVNNVQYPANSSSYANPYSFQPQKSYPNYDTDDYYIAPYKSRSNSDNAEPSYTKQQVY